MKKKRLEVGQIAEHLRDGMSIVYGGFMGTGTPPRIIQAILDSGVKDLTIIGNDGGFPDFGVGPLIVENRVKKLITSHIGLNPHVGHKMFAGEMEVELVPQGTLIERIRSAGAGLGGVLTPTGVGTSVEEGKQKITLNGKEYLIEMPIYSDLSILHACVADEMGNLCYDMAQRNFNPIAALAATVVIAEADLVVGVGEIHPNHVITPGALVDYIVYPQ
jgi:acetate CoA/acetoacetate CoA-transferase alpha subunit